MQSNFNWIFFCPSDRVTAHIYYLVCARQPYLLLHLIHGFSIDECCYPHFTDVENEASKVNYPAYGHIVNEVRPAFLKKKKEEVIFIT